MSKTGIPENTYTEKLYDAFPYQTEFTAVVLSVSPHSDNSAPQLFDLILNRTLFFPEEGGQNADTGIIDGLPVIDVQIKDSIIFHTVSADSQMENLPEAGSEINGSVSWKQRYSNMQQHSGEHIISGLVHSLYGFNNVGFHLSPQNVTLDFDGVLEKNDLEKIETLANEAIYKNIDILAEYPAKENLSSLSYRSKIELTGSVRIVTIPGYDVCACCAPHVKKTGEIGIIKITDDIHYKGGVRINILCGSRALDDFRQKQELVSSVSALTSSRPELIAEAVSRLKGENYSLNGKIADLLSSLIDLKSASIPAADGNLCLFEDVLDSAAHRKYVNQLIGKCSGCCAVFSGNEISGYRYIIASKSEDVRVLNNKLKEHFQAKGGGSKEMVQGSITGNPDDISKLFEGTP